MKEKISIQLYKFAPALTVLAVFGVVGLTVYAASKSLDKISIDFGSDPWKNKI